MKEGWDWRPMPALAESYAKFALEIETHFYHTWELHLSEVESEARSGLGVSIQIVGPSPERR